MSDELNNAQSSLRIAGKHMLLTGAASDGSVWEKKCALAAAVIETDLRDRSGIKHALGEVDDETLQSIRETWRIIISMAMS